MMIRFLAVINNFLSTYSI